MSTSTSASPKASPLLGGLLILFLLVAVFVVLKLFALLTWVVLAGLVVLAVYEGYRLLALLRGGTPPPSSLGVLRGAGRVTLKVARGLPAFVRWGGRTAYVMAHSTHEIATGAVVVGLLGLAAGWQIGFTLTGIFLGACGGIALGTYVGGRRLRAAQPPPPPPAEQSPRPSEAGR